MNDTPLTIVQPDLMIVCNKDKLDGKRCNGAPTSSLKLYLQEILLADIADLLNI